MKLFVGTYNLFYFLNRYEGRLYGWEIEMNNEDEGVKFVVKYMSDTHIGCIRCGCISYKKNKKYLLTGGVDESIRIFDLNNESEFGSLIKHDGSINTLICFNNYVFSGGDDNKVIKWNNNKWECENIFDDINNPISSLSVHNSGKLLLVLTEHNTYCLYNLIDNKQVYKNKLKETATSIQFDQSGKYYLITYYRKIEIYEIGSGEVYYL